MARPSKTNKKWIEIAKQLKNAVIKVNEQRTKLYIKLKQ